MDRQRTHSGYLVIEHDATVQRAIAAVDVAGFDLRADSVLPQPFAAVAPSLTTELG